VGGVDRVGVCSLEESEDGGERTGYVAKGL